MNFHKYWQARLEKIWMTGTVPIQYAAHSAGGSDASHHLK